MRGITLPSEPCASGSEISDLTPILNPFLNTSQKERRKLFLMKRPTHIKKKVTYGQAVIIALYKVPVEDCVRDALFCEVCCIFDEALGEVPYHYRLYGVIHQLSYKANSHWATPAWPTHIPHLTTWLYLCHSPHSISKRPITWPHWCRAAMFDLRHGFSSKGRDFPLPFSL